MAALLKRKEYELPGVAELLIAHEAATSFGHDLAELSTQRSVQQLLSKERHEVMFQKLMAKSSTRSSNLMLASSMPHASDWLLAPRLQASVSSCSPRSFAPLLNFGWASLCTVRSPSLVLP